MNSQPLVSVIVPNFNHARFLPTRLESILAQTYNNIELILLDDHSSDNSAEILEGYRDNPFVSVIIINDHNSGSTFRQWDLGIQHAKGDLIWIAESDDSSDPSFLESLVEAFLSVPNCAISYCSTLWIDENGNPLPTPVKDDHDIVFTGKDFITERLDIGTAIWNASSAIFRKELIDKIPSVYKSFRNTGDHLFWIELAKCEGSNVVLLHKQLNFCRQHNNNISAQKDRLYNVFYEERLIFNIQLEYGFIYGLKKHYVIDRYRTMILSKTFINESDRKKALNIWGVEKSWQWIFTKFLARIYRLNNRL